MPEISKADARAGLGKSGLGIGERHGNDDGRNFVLELLGEGRVRALFLEVKSHCQGVIEKAKQVKDDPLQLVGELGSLYGPEHGGGDVRLSRLAARAITLNIPVYCIDVHASDHGDPWLKDAHKEAVQIRDQCAANLFRRCVNTWHGGNRAGCLLLFGAAHLTGTNPGGWQGKQECLADYLKLYYVLCV